MTAFLPGSARVVYLLFFVLVSAANLCAAKAPWLPVSAEELAAAAPQDGSTAAAEIAFLRIEIDDRSFPLERKTTRYVRYKIFSPENADEITRMKDVQITGSLDRTEIFARLTSPNGQVQEFGKESVKERPLVQQAQQAGFLGWLAGANEVAKERFLAISGVERGAVLEYYTVQTDRSPEAIDYIYGQHETFPTRRFDYRIRYQADDVWVHRTFVSNMGTAKLTHEEKTKTMIVSGTNLPAISREPFGGPTTDQVLTVFNCYEQTEMLLEPRSGKVPMPGTVEAKAGPWAPYATLMDWAARDRGVPTKRSTQLAAEITKAAKTDEEKAVAIHRWVRAEWLAYRVQHSNKERIHPADSLDDVIAWQKEKGRFFNSWDFMWLALSLYRTVGLTAQTILLPDRSFARFNPNNVSRLFLPKQAIVVKIGEGWQFSCPHNIYGLPFNMLPPSQEGQAGLLAQSKKQEFIQVPATDAERSLVGTSGQLELDEDGGLRGTFIRRFTGQMAGQLRGELQETAEADRRDFVKKKLGLELKDAEITVKKIDGLDDPEKPLDFACDLNWPGFAVRTKDRLIVRPLVFRTETTTPFPAEERKRPVIFPCCWQELDQLHLIMPAGYEPVSPTIPGPVPGTALHYRVSLGIDEDKNLLQVRREFMLNVLAVGVDRYAALRKFYDHVARSDRHEIVLRKKATASAK